MRLSNQNDPMEPECLRKEIFTDTILIELSKLAKKEKIRLFLVGGFIRDLFLRARRKDYDFTLPKEDASSIRIIEDVLRLRFFKVGKEELGTATYRVVNGGVSIDLAFFQGETIDEDLQRRDFTINAIAFSLQDETFHWAQGALEDIEGKTIRTVSNRSIDQDPLRMLRAVRYLSTLEGFVVDEGLKKEIFLKKDRIRELPGERIKMELDRILPSPRVAEGIKLLRESGLLMALFPEFKRIENLSQNEHHHLDALSHTLLAVEKVSWAFQWVGLNGKDIFLTQEDRLSLLYAVLFHDLGKADVFGKDQMGRVHFYRHEFFSSLAAEQIMERLRFSNAMRDRTLHLIRNHMRIHNLSEETKEPALRRLVHEMGDETPLLVLLTLADKEASRGPLSLRTDQVTQRHCLCTLELFAQKEIVRPAPLITGNDVLALGYSPGPKVGRILDFIRQRQVEGEIKTREQALDALRVRFGIHPSSD